MSFSKVGSYASQNYQLFSTISSSLSSRRSAGRSNALFRQAFRTGCLSSFALFYGIYLATFIDNNFLASTPLFLGEIAIILRLV